MHYYPQEEVQTEEEHCVQKNEAVPLENGSNGKGQLELVNISTSKAVEGIKFSQVHKSCSNDWALKNMEVASCTRDTFQEDKSWLKDVAPANCATKRCGVRDNPLHNMNI